MVVSMPKHIHFAIALVCVFFLIAILLVPQTHAAASYYSNNFDSATALDDGYWSLHSAEIQTVNDAQVLAVTGEATFMPQHGDYDLNNFTVQFDVFHNIVYENNSAFQGPFYEATDSEGNVIIRMGIYQRQMHDNDMQQVGGLAFSQEITGETSHYYFLFNHAADWSTWRLTVTTVSTEGGYLANVTLQINGETITDFATGLPRADGMGEIFVSNITNEPILNPVAYQNLLPLPQAGVLVPTYPPTVYSDSGVSYDLMSNTRVKPVSSSGATPSYVDNFYYGYADTVPLTTVSTTPTPTSSNTTPFPTINTGPHPPPAEPFPTALIIVLVAAVVVVSAASVVYFNRRKHQP
jgi:hypothetical protein